MRAGRGAAAPRLDLPGHQDPAARRRLPHQAGGELARGALQRATLRPRGRQPNALGCGLGCARSGLSGSHTLSLCPWQDDEALLAEPQPAGRLTPCARLAVLLRLEEKQLLGEALKYVEQRLDKPTAS